MKRYFLHIHSFLLQFRNLPYALSLLKTHDKDPWRYIVFFNLWNTNKWIIPEYVPTSLTIRRFKSEICFFWQIQSEFFPKPLIFEFWKHNTRYFYSQIDHCQIPWDSFFYPSMLDLHGYSFPCFLQNSFMYLGKRCRCDRGFVKVLKHFIYWSS